MMLRRLEILPENLRGHFDPLAFPFVTTENPPDDRPSGPAAGIGGNPLQGVEHIYRRTRAAGQRHLSSRSPRASVGRGEPAWTKHT
jgi:hypothetical protein